MEFFGSFKPAAWQLQMLRDALERRAEERRTTEISGRMERMRAEYLRQFEAMRRAQGPPVNRDLGFTLEVIDARDGRLWGWCRVPTLQLWNLHVGVCSRILVDVEMPLPRFIIDPEKGLDGPVPITNIPFVELRIGAWANAGAQPRLTYLVDNDEQLRRLVKTGAFKLYTPTPH